MMARGSSGFWKFLQTGICSDSVSMGTSWISKVSLQPAQTHLGLSENRVYRYTWNAGYVSSFPDQTGDAHNFCCNGIPTFPVKTDQKYSAPSLWPSTINKSQLHLSRHKTYSRPTLLNQKNVSGNFYSQWLIDHVEKHGASMYCLRLTRSNESCKEHLGGPWQFDVGKYANPWYHNPAFEYPQYLTTQSDDCMPKDHWKQMWQSVHMEKSLLRMQSNLEHFDALKLAICQKLPLWETKHKTEWELMMIMEIWAHEV